MLWDWELELELERRQWRRGKDTKDSGRVNTFLIVSVLLCQKKDCAYFAFLLTTTCQELFFTIRNSFIINELQRRGGRACVSP